MLIFGGVAALYFEYAEKWIDLILGLIQTFIWAQFVIHNTLKILPIVDADNGYYAALAINSDFSLFCRSAKSLKDANNQQLEASKDRETISEPTKTPSKTHEERS